MYILERKKPYTNLEQTYCSSIKKTNLVQLQVASPYILSLLNLKFGKRNKISCCV